MAEKLYEMLWKPIEIPQLFSKTRFKVKIHEFLKKHWPEDYDPAVNKELSNKLRYIDGILKKHKIEFNIWFMDIVQTGFLWCVPLSLIPLFRSNLFWTYKIMIAIVPVGVLMYMLQELYVFLRKGR